MKWRIVLTVLFVLLLFGGFAYLYVNTFVRKHQHAVILFVVNGLDLNTLNVARQQLGRSPLHSEPDDPAINDARRRAAYRSEVLNLDSLWNIALLGLQDPGQPVPDEGADATALACGQRVENGFVAINHNQSLPSLIYLAEKAQRATGLVTTSSVVQPTPVAFYSTINGTPDPYRNASELVYSRIDVVLGGGEQYFLPANATNEWGRLDGRNLIDEAKSSGYTIVQSRDELNNVSTWPTFHTRQIFGLFAPDQFYFSSLQPDNRRQPTLAEMTRVAISCLNYSNGYFLVVEHDLVARAEERNFGRLAINEVAEVDEAIQSAIDYAGPDALIIVTNNYSLGALGSLPTPSAADLVAAPATLDANGDAVRPQAIPMAPPPQPAWLAGPGGPTLTRAQAAWLQNHGDEGWFSSDPPGLLQPDPALRFQTQAAPLAEPAWLASRGEGSSQLRGFLNNTDVFDIVNENF
jgi:alkaline phosphatase